MKTQEQRIEDAARELERIRVNASDDIVPSTRVCARLMLEAADREPTSWPTNESLGRLFEMVQVRGGPQFREGEYARLRDAMLVAPIIKAAIALRDAHLTPSPHTRFDALVRAVDEAGL